mmetsp:Transcript_4008/g.5559  ORF Transcript_4008/g.5559 Transcript_4008/m.5559 type:complete len:214 (-) Transcript_4008:102-743(-)
MKALIAKVLGYLILVGSVLLKAPQIYNIMISKSAEGLSAIALYIEVLTSMTGIVYNFKYNNPFSSYGETAIILIQNFVIIALLWTFMKPKPLPSFQLGIIALFLVLSVICYYIPMEFQYLLPLSNIPLLLSSRIAQIATNFKDRSTGQLSIITTFLTFVGCLIRVFTTIQEVGLDFSLLLGFLLNAALSAVLLLQIVWYCYISPPTKGKKKDE